MASQDDRIERQKEDDRSLLKSFLEDQLGILLTIFGALPLLSDSFIKINAPAFLNEEALKTINFATIFVAGIVIIFFYGERWRLRGEVRFYAAILSLMLFSGGIALWILSLFFKVGISSLVDKSKAIKPNAGLNISDSSFILQNDGSFSIRYDYWVIFVLIVFMILLVVQQVQSRLLTLIYTYDIQGFIGNNQSVEEKPSRIYSFKYLIQSRRIIFSIIYSIITLISIYLLIIPFFKSDIPKMVVTSSTLSLTHLLIYVLSYPMFLTGSIFMLIIVLAKYSRRGNFFQQVSSLSDQYYLPIETIVSRLSIFETWFEHQEKIMRTNMLTLKGSADSDLLSEYDSLQLAKRTFIWRAMREKLLFYSDVITKLSSVTNRNLYVAGELIDRILYFMPSNAQTVKSFKAVSHDDLFFWRKRGEEYLGWNRQMYLNGIKVERIFLFNSLYSLADEGEELFVENLQVIFQQIGSGIDIGICYMDRLSSADVDQVEPYFDFGVFPDFAISFFEKPLHVGGRSLRMNFENGFIQKLSNHYESIKRSCYYTYFTPTKDRRWNRVADYENELSGKEVIIIELIKDFVDKFVKKYWQECSTFPWIKADDEKANLAKHIKKAFEGWMMDYERQIKMEIFDHIQKYPSEADKNKSLKERIEQNPFAFKDSQIFQEFQQEWQIELPNNNHV